MSVEQLPLFSLTTESSLSAAIGGFHEHMILLDRLQPQLAGSRGSNGGCSLSSRILAAKPLPRR